jgi:hypothetical protein
VVTAGRRKTNFLNFLRRVQNFLGLSVLTRVKNHITAWADMWQLDIGSQYNFLNNLRCVQRRGRQRIITHGGWAQLGTTKHTSWTFRDVCKNRSTDNPAQNQPWQRELYKESFFLCQNQSGFDKAYDLVTNSQISPYWVLSKSSIPRDRSSHLL